MPLFGGMGYWRQTSTPHRPPPLPVSLSCGCHGVHRPPPCFSAVVTVFCILFSRAKDYINKILSHTLLNTHAKAARGGRREGAALNTATTAERDGEGGQRRARQPRLKETETGGAAQNTATTAERDGEGGQRGTRQPRLKETATVGAAHTN